MMRFAICIARQDREEPLRHDKSDNQEGKNER